jgi:hypothetical protein
VAFSWDFEIFSYGKKMRQLGLGYGSGLAQHVGPKEKLEYMNGCCGFLNFELKNWLQYLKFESRDMKFKPKDILSLRQGFGYKEFSN